MHPGKDRDRLLPIVDRSARAGFTLVEILVVIAVIATLGTLAVTAAGEMRRQALATRCHANMNQSGQALLRYLGTYRDSFPFFANPHEDPPLRNGGYAVGYFAQEVLWPKVFQGEFEHDQLSATTQCPASPVARTVLREGRLAEYLAQYGRSYVDPSSYWLSGTVLADPAFFRPHAQEAPKHLMRATRSSEVVFPSAKGIFVEVRAYHQKPIDFGQIDPRASLLSDIESPVRFSIWFLDGHVQTRRRSELTNGVRVTPIASPTPVLRTPEGLRGRDVP